MKINVGDLFRVENSLDGKVNVGFVENILDNGMIKVKWSWDDGWDVLFYVSSFEWYFEYPGRTEYHFSHYPRRGV